MGVWVTRHRRDLIELPTPNGGWECFLRSAGDERRNGRNGLVDRVVAPVAVRVARAAFFLDVGDFAARGELAIASDDAPAIQRPKSEESNQAHCRTLRSIHAQSKRCAFGCW